MTRLTESLVRPLLYLTDSFTNTLYSVMYSSSVQVVVVDYRTMVRTSKIGKLDRVTDPYRQKHKIIRKTYKLKHTVDR